MNFGTVERGTPPYIQNLVPKGSYVLFGRVPTRSNNKTDAENQGVKHNSCSKSCSIWKLLRVEQPMKNSQSPFHSKRDPKRAAMREQPGQDRELAQKLTQRRPSVTSQALSARWEAGHCPQDAVLELNDGK